MGVVLPSGFLAEDGSAYSRTTYANLWAALSITTFGTLTSGQVTKLKVQEYTSDSAGNYADVTGAITAAAADADAGKLLILDVYKPQQRWIRPVIVRGTQNAVIVSGIVELYQADFQPVSLTDSTNISSAVVFNSPP